MAELLNHQHCKNCDRAVPFGQELCTDKCREEWAAYQKKRKNTVRMFYISSAAIGLLLIYQLAGRAL